jgi:hypothetical protein
MRQRGGCLRAMNARAHLSPRASSVLLRPPFAADVVVARLEAATAQRGAEGIDPLAPARLLHRAGEQPDPAVPVRQKVIDEQVDAGRVVEENRAVARFADRTVEEHAWSSAASDKPVELVACDTHSRDEEPVDAVREQRTKGGKLAVGRLAGVHQEDAVPGLLERALRALERRRIERARDVRNDEADRKGRASPQRAGKLRRLETEEISRLDDGRARLRGQLAPAVQGARGGRRRDPGVLGDVRERDLAPGPQTIAQAIATLT